MRFWKKIDRLIILVLTLVVLIGLYTFFRWLFGETAADIILVIFVLIALYVAYEIHRASK